MRAGSGSGRARGRFRRDAPKEADVDVAVEKVARAGEETLEVWWFQVGGVFPRAAPHLEEVERASVVHVDVQVVGQAARLAQGVWDERRQGFPECLFPPCPRTQAGD